MYIAHLLHTPVGALQLLADDKHLLRMEFLDEPPQTIPEPNAVLVAAVEQLTAYFSGKLKTFDLPLAPAGTEFQQRVWDQLVKIPFGATISYLTLAQRLGDEKCIRAAASANGKNPIGLIIPCHRVIGADGKLVGFSAGLWRKKILLQHEIHHSDTPVGTLF